MKYEYWLVNGVIYDKFFEVEKLDVLYGDYLFITNEDAGTHIPTYKFPDGDMLTKTEIEKIAKLIQRAIDNNTKLKAEDIDEIVHDYPDDVLI
mgnify:FL=1